MPDSPRPPIHHRLWSTGKLETRLQLVQYRERGVEPRDTLVLIVDLRCQVAREVFMAVTDEPEEMAKRLAAAGPDEPATAPMVLPIEMGQIIVGEIWPHLMVELVGKPREAVAVLTVAGEDEVLLSFAEVEVWGQN